MEIKMNLQRGGTITLDCIPYQNLKNEPYCFKVARTSLRRIYLPYKEELLEYLEKSKPLGHCFLVYNTDSEYADLDSLFYMIHIPSLNSLIAFQEIYGDIIIRQDDIIPNLKVLEIYDYYRE